MGFLQSAINQVGRDLGRVASNAIFKDRHAIPIRRAASYQQKQQQHYKPQQPQAQPIQEVKAKFDSAINFKTGYKPNTLISKLGGAFIVIKNEARAFVDDGYLDVDESEQLFDMLKRFNHKVSDVDDVMSFTEAEDSKYYDQLNDIVKKTKTVFVETLEVSIKACEQRAKQYEELAEQQEFFSFGEYLKLHLLWFPKHAKGGEKKNTQAIIANIIDVVTLTFPITRSVLLLIGLSSYNSQKQQHQNLVQAYQSRAAQERERVKIYQELVEKNS
ncbi:hypothetical protein [Flavobacteriaceae bacterium 14752]|uniref:hypothetical protein n=1 Tax=Mesohalobacter salilacus TaxID=2491711 RepID=UPI000F637D54|nr:hypothetical protein EIG84_10795 [Flavobacteriaceae bacterium 14752]